MSTNQCPGCGGALTATRSQDLTVDRCENCGGIWLDESELNTLATGMAGDIEYCTIDGEQHDDRFTTRQCPGCTGQDMCKVGLLCYTDIVFDYCPACHGFYLDQGEIQQANLKLADLTEDKHAEEFRGQVNGILVRLDKVKDAGFSQLGGGLIPLPSKFCYLKLSVYFNTPLGLGLSVFSEKWTDKLLKLVHLSRRQDIQTGHAELDSAFVIQGDREAEITSLLTGEPLVSRLLEFHGDRPRLGDSQVSLSVDDERLVATAGPLAVDTVYDVEADPAGIVGRLVELARLFSGEG